MRQELFLIVAPPWPLPEEGSLPLEWLEFESPVPDLGRAVESHRGAVVAAALAFAFLRPRPREVGSMAPKIDPAG